MEHRSRGGRETGETCATQKAGVPRMRRERQEDPTFAGGVLPSG